jgi:uncharacterized membrane protein YdjX (TVP38/TMEM64 family)
MVKGLQRNSALVRFIKKTMVPWYLVTTILYFLAIPLTIWVFPATTLILSVFVLFGGFTASMASLASALVTAEQDEQIVGESGEDGSRT